jgi:hypothetical protein
MRGCEVALLSAFVSFFPTIGHALISYVPLVIVIVLGAPYAKP